MPKVRKVPSLRLHKSTGQAVVTLGSKDFYCGVHGSPASETRYEQFVSAWLAAGRPSHWSGEVPPSGPGGGFSVAELCEAYLTHADHWYRHPTTGAKTSEVKGIECALVPLVEMYGTEPVTEFGPLKLKSVRAQLVEKNLARTTVNQHVCRIRRMFRWGVEEEKVPGGVHQALGAVRGLQKGRGDAREPPAVKPVPLDHVSKTLPYLAPTVAAMVRVQLLSGARPGEVCSIQVGSIDRTVEPWEYRPDHHKTAHHGKDRVIYFPEEAQAILAQFLDGRGDHEFVFSPQQADRERAEMRRASRKTPLYPSHDAVARRARRRKRPPGESYSVASYRNAITYALRRLKSEEGIALRWNPNQLRHTAGTIARRLDGVEGSKTYLGHTETSTTEIYAELDQERARRVTAMVAEEIGRFGE